LSPKPKIGSIFTNTGKNSCNENIMHPNVEFLLCMGIGNFHVMMSTIPTRPRLLLCYVCERDTHTQILQIRTILLRIK